MGFQNESVDSKYKKYIVLLRKPATRAKSDLKASIQKTQKRFLDQTEKLEIGEEKNRLLKKLNKVTEDLQILENLCEDDIIEFALTSTRNVMAVASNPRVPKEMRMKARVASHKPLSSHLARVRSLGEAEAESEEEEEETETDDIVTGNLNKVTLNNQIVKMRGDVKRAKVHLIHKFTRTVKLLRNSKGNEEKKIKCQRKAERFVKKIQHIKEVEPDDVSRFALSTKTEDIEKLLADVKIPMKSQAMAIITLQKFVAVAVKDFRNKFPDWSKTVPSLFKKKKKKRNLDEEILIGANKKLKQDLRITNDNDREDSNEENEKYETENHGRSDINNSESEEESLKSDNENEKDDSLRYKVNGETCVDSEEKDSENGIDEDRDDSDREEDIESDFKNRGEKEESSSTVNKFNKNSETYLKTSSVKKIALKSLKQHLELPKPELVSSTSPKPTNNSQKKLNIEVKNIDEGKVSDKGSFLKKFVKPKVIKEKPMVVDPFFMTTTNEEYLTSQVPTFSEGNDSHRQSKSDDFNQTRFDKFTKFNNKNKWGSHEVDWKQKKFSNQETQHNQKTSFNNGPEPFNIFANRKERRKAKQQPPVQEAPVEKLHPSWEAKKKQTSIAAFQGKKITFD